MCNEVCRGGAERASQTQCSPDLWIGSVTRLNAAHQDLRCEAMRNDSVFNRSARLEWGAAVLAGLIAGVIAWLLSHGIPWFTSGLVSPTLMGRDLKPPGLIDPYRSVITVLAQLVVAIGYSLVIAPLVTRFRGVWAIGAGGLIGLALYGCNFCVFHFLLRVDWSNGELAVVVTHVVFGMLAAGAYKGLAARRALVSFRDS
jgi:hypothetical protein